MSQTSTKKTVSVESSFTDSIFSLVIAAVFSMLGLSVGGPLILLAINPPRPDANARGPQREFSSGAALATGLLCPLGAFGLSGLLVWLRLRHVERFEADEQGVNWFKPYRFRGRIEWRELRRIHVNNGQDQLVLEGPVGAHPFLISHHHANFQPFLERLRQLLPWEALTRARPMLEDIVPGIGDDAATNPVEVGPATPVPPVASTRVTLPIEQSRFGMALFPLAGALLFATLGGTIWYFTAFPRPAVNGAPAPDNSDFLKDVSLIVGLFVVSAGLIRFIFVPWYRVRVEEHGIQITYLCRSRQVGWESVAEVRVELGGTYKQAGVASFFQRLIIQLTDNTQIALPLADRSASARDAIIRAANRAGVPLTQ